jgi:hypothetical protein
MASLLPQIRFCNVAARNVPSVMRASFHLLEPPVKRPVRSPVPRVRRSAHFEPGGQEPFVLLWFGPESAREACICKQMHENRADPAMTERNEQPTAPYPAEKARGGEIILRTPLRRAIFIAGLAGAVVLALLLAFARFAH